MVHLTMRQSNLVRHQGGCHCGAVRFEVLAPPSLTVFECNCSICVKKQIKYFLAPFNQFKLVKGHDSLKTYSFNTHQAKHNFCATCGVQPFHIPSSNPEAYGIAMHSLDEGTVKKVTYEKIDSKKGEQPKRKVSGAGEKASASVTTPKNADKTESKEQPQRKTSLIALINSINTWGQGLSSNASEAPPSAQDPPKEADGGQTAASLEVPQPDAEVEEKTSPLPSSHRKFIVTRVESRSPMTAQ